MSKIKLTIYFFTLFLGLTLASSASAAITIRPALNLGLTAYWSMDEGSGSVINDHSGYGNNGTSYSSTTPAASWVDGKLGPGLSFDGTDDKLTIANDVSTYLNMTNGSISVWFKASSSIAGGDVLYSFANNGDSIGIRFSTVHTVVLDHRADFGAGNGISVEIGDMTTNDSWHHLAATWDVNGGSQTMTMTFDGTRYTDDTAIATPAAYGGTAYLANSGSYYFSGDMDEVRIYNRALSAGEVTRLYNLTRPKFKAASSLGLVGYWPMDDGQGTIAGDMSGHGNSGTITGASWTDGKRGEALSFDGVTSYVDTGSASLGITNAITVSAWVKSNSDVSGRIASKHTTGSYGWMLSRDDPDDKILWGISSDGDNWDAEFTSSNSFPINQWIHIAITYNGSSEKAYINGVEDTGGDFPYTTAWNINNSTGSTQIGRDGYIGDSGIFDGQIDEVRIYNRALSADEVANLYSASKKIFKVSASQNNKLTDGLVGLWSFNGPDVSGNIAIDRSDSGNNGTITGATIAIGKVGQALGFDGSSNQNVNVGTSNFVCATGSPMTISAWINPRSLGENSGGRIFSRRTTADAYDCTLQFTSGGSPNGIQFAWTGDTSLLRRSLSNPITLNTWQHVLITWDGSLTASNVHIYLNSSELTYSTTTNGSGLFATTDQPSFIGKRASDDRDFDGKIDEVRVYNRVLSAAEIKRLYEMGK